MSDTPDYKPSDLVVAHTPAAEYAALKRENLWCTSNRIRTPRGFKDLGVFLGPLGSITFRPIAKMVSKVFKSLSNGVFSYKDLSFSTKI